MVSDDSNCIEQQALQTTHNIMRMFACYETVMVEKKRLCVARFQYLISSSYCQGLVFIAGDDNPDDPRIVQWEVYLPSTRIRLLDLILPTNFCKCKYIFCMVETNNTGCFLKYSGITKIYYRKTVGHVFKKPVQIEGKTQFFFPISCFSS
jgi:hypothetical protein